MADSYDIKDENGNILGKLTSDTPPTEEQFQQAVAGLAKNALPATGNPAAEMLNPQAGSGQVNQQAGRDFLNLVAETSTGIQRPITSLIDFAATPLRAAAAETEEWLGSERSAEDLFYDKYSLRSKVPERGAFAGEGFSSAVAGGAGEMTGMMAGGGGLQRFIAQMATKGLQHGPSVARNVFQLLGSGKPIDDVVLGVQAGVGGEIAAEIAPEKYETIARLGGQVLTPAMVQASLNGAVNFGRNVLMKDATPDTQALRGASSHIYTQLDTLGVKLAAKEKTTLTTNLQQFLDDPLKITNDAIYNPLRTRINNLIKQVTEGSGTFSEINTARTALREQGRGVSQEATAARQAAEIVDDVLGATHSNPAITLAGSLWRRGSASQKIDTVFNNAALDATASRGVGSPANFEYQLRTEITKLLKDPNSSRSFTKPNLKTMKEFVEGGTWENTLGKMGSRLGNFVGPLVIGGLSSVGTATLYGTVPTMAAAVGAGTAGIVWGIGKIASNMSTTILKNNAQLMKRMINQGDNSLGIAESYMATTPRSRRDPKALAVLLTESKADISKIWGTAFGRSKFGAEVVGFHSLLNEALQEEAEITNANLAAQMPN
tara:strand:- start:72 stop:1883 length:1812 start_codon:yes stop_codon:yes gene_type:complete